MRRITCFGSDMRYIRTAHSRNSSGYFLGAGISRAPLCESYLTFCHHSPHPGGTSAFAPNHKGMDMSDPDGDKWGHLRHQVLTSRNIKGSVPTD